MYFFYPFLCSNYPKHLSNSPHVTFVITCDEFSVCVPICVSTHFYMSQIANYPAATVIHHWELTEVIQRVSALGHPNTKGQ